jgi:hypothetical protein
MSIRVEQAWQREKEREIKTSRDRDRQRERERDSSVESHMLFCSSSRRDTCYDVT